MRGEKLELALVGFTAAAVVAIVLGVLALVRGVPVVERGSAECRPAASAPAPPRRG